MGHDTANDVLAQLAQTQYADPFFLKREATLASTHLSGNF